MRARLVPTLALAAAVCLVGCARRPPNVLIILMDTLRFDRLGAYGSTRGLTPFLDSLAERGYVFRRAYAQSSWTNPSVASLFTSRFQSQHGVISFGSVLPGEELTLAEVLKQHGFKTGAFVGNLLINQQNGFAQGFDQFEVVAGAAVAPGAWSRFAKGRAEDIKPRALSWVEQTRASAPASPIFLYLHYMEPHAPYQPPAELIARMLDGRPAPDLAEVNTRMILPYPPFEEEFVQGLAELYDAEVASLDAQLRELFAELQARHFLDRAVVVLLADHGEELLEHGLVGHNQTLYEEVIRVPLILLLPGHTTRTDVGDVVSLIDVAPTLAELLGIPSPPSFEGRPPSAVTDGESWRPGALWRRWLAGPPASRPAFSELIKAPETLRLSPHEYDVVWDRSKLIEGVEGEREYYDLGSDPGERDRGGLAGAARERLEQTIEEFKRRATPARVIEPAIDPQTRERMRALGYVE